jgi:glycerol-3-phosphate dehydrogenase (NAD(P)+)
MANYDCVGVVGGGSWGTTLAHILGQCGHNVLLGLRDPKVMEEVNRQHRNSKYTEGAALSEKITAVQDLALLAQRCEVIFMALPASSFREVAYRLGNYLQGDQIMVSGCKGLEVGTRARITSIIREETCIRKIGVLSGPDLFVEILQGSPSATVIASYYQEVLDKVRKLLFTPFFKVYANADVLGVELGGVVKNIISIAAGIVDGLGFGVNCKAFLLTRGLAEMGRIGAAMGANPTTFTGLSGIGDLILSCSSKLSRNYRVGYYLAQGKTLPQIFEEMKFVAEGINTAEVIHEYAKEHRLEVPLMEGVYQILHKERNIHEVVSELLNRPSKLEIDMTLFEYKNSQ